MSEPRRRNVESSGNLRMPKPISRDEERRISYACFDAYCEFERKDYPKMLELSRMVPTDTRTRGSGRSRGSGFPKEALEARRRKMAMRAEAM